MERRGVICLWCRTKVSGIERWSVGNRHVPFITRFVTERQEARSRPCLTSRYPPALTSRHRAPATWYRGVSGVVRHWYRKTSAVVKYLVWRGGSCPNLCRVAGHRATPVPAPTPLLLHIPPPNYITGRRSLLLVFLHFYFSNFHLRRNYCRCLTAQRENSYRLDLLIGLN